MPAFYQAGVAFLISAILLIAFYVCAFRWIYPEFIPFMDRDASLIEANGKDLIPVSVGKFQTEGAAAIISRFKGDEALLVLPKAFSAEDYPFIKVNLTGLTRYTKFKILWQRAEDTSQIHALEFNRSGDQVAQIAMTSGGAAYRGAISSIALLFYNGPALEFENNEGSKITIENIELRPFSASAVITQIYEDWSNSPLLTGYSNNVVIGAHKDAMLLPNVAANLIVGVGAIVAIIRSKWRRRVRRATPSQPLIPVLLTLCLFGWIFNEACRWQWRIEQISDTRDRYIARPLEERIRRNPQRCARFPEDCKAQLLPYY